MGRRRGRPRPLRTPEMASKVALSIMLSWRLAPDSVRPSGVPCRSVTRWRLVPGLPRSVGFGPVSAPPFWRADWHCPAPLGSSPGREPRTAAPEAHDAAAPKPRPHAMRKGAASMSCPNRPTRPERRATGNRCEERTRCQPGPPGHRCADARPSAWNGVAEEAAPQPPIDRRKQDGPSQPNALKAVLSPALSVSRPNKQPNARLALPVVDILPALPPLIERLRTSC